MDTIIITGGTGPVGKALTKHLVNKGYHVIIFTRKLPQNIEADTQISYSLWNVKDKTLDIAAIQKASYIVHLAGAGVVDKRWSALYKKEILDSRTKSSELILQALQQNENRVKTIVSASAIGWYGTDNEMQKNNEGFSETAPATTDFLGETCKLWEECVNAATLMGKRVVKLRTGIVLSREGGALPEFERPLKFGIAGILGSGKQMVSWIHIDDLCRLYVEAIQNSQLSGTYNAVAPAPVSNKTLTLELAKTVRGKFFIPIHVPAFVLKIIMGESSIEVLKSCTVSCEKIKRAGFTFLYPSIEAALNELYKK